MTTKQELIMKLNLEFHPWGDCQERAYRNYELLKQMNKKPKLMGYKDKSHMWVEQNGFVIDEVLWNLFNNKDLIYDKKRFYDLMKYIDETKYMTIMEVM